jgi:hypothetical protein
MQLRYGLTRDYWTLKSFIGLFLPLPFVARPRLRRGLRRTPKF